MAPDASSPANEAKLAELRAALDVGVDELNAGLGVESSVDELMADVSSEAGVEP